MVVEHVERRLLPRNRMDSVSLAENRSGSKAHFGPARFGNFHWFRSRLEFLLDTEVRQHRRHLGHIDRGQIARMDPLLSDTRDIGPLRPKSGDQTKSIELMQPRLGSV